MAINTRSVYKYVSDYGTTYLVSLDTSNSLVPNTGLVAAASPADDNLERLPRGVTMRHVNVLNVATGSKRRLVCGTAEAQFFRTGGTVTLQQVADADGEPYTATGAVGEKRTFLRLPVTP